MSQYFDKEKKNYPDDPDEFTLDLMIGIVGEKNMFFDSEIKERNNKQSNTKPTNPTMKDRFESARTQSESSPQCPAPEKSFSKER